MTDNEFTKYLEARMLHEQNYQYRMNRIAQERILWDIILCIFFGVALSWPLIMYIDHVTTPETEQNQP